MFVFNAVTVRLPTRTAAVVELTEDLLLTSVTDASFNAQPVESSTCAKNDTFKIIFMTHRLLEGRVASVAVNTAAPAAVIKD